MVSFEDNAKEREERAYHPLSGSLFKTLGSTLGTI